MPTAEAPAKPQPETWVDWLAGRPEPSEDELLTRDEVLSHTARLGAPVTESELRYWTALGVVPRPVRRWFRGATRGTYPKWAVIVLYAAHELHRTGIPLPGIGRRLRFAFRDGPDQFLKHFILIVLLEPLGAAARHLRLHVGVTYDHAEVRFTRGGDPDTAVTLEAKLFL